MAGQDKKMYSMTEEVFNQLKADITGKIEKNVPMDYESLDGYELPPRTQFSMTKKPSVTFKMGKMTFNMASIRSFEGIKYILPIVNSKTKRFSAIPCEEEENSSVEWARLQQKTGKIVNKPITSTEFINKIFDFMGWDKECRYKVIGRLAVSECGIILVFDLEEAIMFAPKKQTYIDSKTGETKQREVKYYPDKYKDCIGMSYNDYVELKRRNMFEDISEYDETPGAVVEMDESIIEQPAAAAGSEGMKVPGVSGQLCLPIAISNSDTIPD